MVPVSLMASANTSSGTHQASQKVGGDSLRQCLLFAVFTQMKGFVLATAGTASVGSRALDLSLE